MEISIIGGGITGLTTALALSKLGIPAKVYEQAESLNEIGAGIWLQPNAMKVLQWLGLEKEIKQAGCTLNKMEITYPDLTPIKKINKAVVSDSDGNQTIAIHRAKLQSILFDKLKETSHIELGKSYINHELVNKKIEIQFKDESISSDIVLGADGIHSKVRATMGLPSQYRNTNQICCRGIATIELPEHLQAEGKEVWGHKKRFGFSQLSDEKVYYFTVLNKNNCPSNLDQNSLIDQFKEFDPIVSQIIASSETFHETELYDLKRLPNWYNTHSCLIGDAAHATTPNMGQGACQGIEDAYYISNLLKSSEKPADAFKQFELKRRKKVEYVVNNSWNFGKMAHNPFGQLIMKTMMKITPEKVISKQMNKLYEVDGL
ncbi:FAD-dependent monooxygenase [Marivirga arenosa]|uniref:FAD-dependent monooxygenase n=1 Tax=Marivirga arenosa TaxID=3059076 RepID=A0AA51R6F4_9BACT|nr:FAD-dependent monooxygenase [Marivirga sp. ABR2-2]WMN06607.1 FAD-dependent monooxygenase [Marivirga sp. ABR2-2]